jgi:hypothetical protein
MSRKLRLYLGFIGATGVLSFLFRWLIHDWVPTFLFDRAFGAMATEIASWTGIPEARLIASMQDIGVPIVLAALTIWAAYRIAFRHAHAQAASQTIPISAELSSQKQTDPFFYFSADILDPKNLTAACPGRIVNEGNIPFHEVDSWFSPEAANRNPDPPDGDYWSLRHLKVTWRTLHRGAFRTGKNIPPGHYWVEYNAICNDVSCGFHELLRIREFKGELVQLIDVWKDGGGKVYSSPRPPELNSLPAPDSPIDAPIWRAVAYVRRAINDTNHQKCYPATLTAIRQAALDGKIKLRGRREIDVGGGPQTFSDVSSDIPAEYWKVSTIGALATSEEGWGSYPHTNPETLYAWGPKGIYEKKRYADLTVNMQEIKRLWPSR